MNAKTKNEAMKCAGFREKYAMTHGKERRKVENGNVLYVFTYSEFMPYQDANGATYDATHHAWIA